MIEDRDSRARAALTAVAWAMYIHRMVRTQLYLDEETHAHLKELGRKQGRTISELVRDALARAYAPGRATQRIATLHAIEGLWRDRDDLGTTRAYVRRLRRDTRRRHRRS